ncbi:hypothetical protein GCM10011376_27980 [Nocardioides flavus (ex Wang et al. 2016)]|uniref:PqqD family protein n=1 Tax=Nocardioides flavus (ex Wang et al. 2016) TaxID=2058780 RepID=A0ABQ3HKI3_9ACTN|nr:PqqD family protein [Nocardioides flavus (ex Wang et al. 2016)]GHE18188.1 hypothetical protein GCM10011376_27980 [Nocardioides flavus (ex Wang et al. 2016)]
MMVDGPSTVRLRDRDLVMREIDGEAVLLDLAGSTYLAANSTGTFLLRLLTESQDHPSLVSSLVREFGISTAQADADASSFVAALAEQGLLIHTRMDDGG